MKTSVTVVGGEAVARGVAWKHLPSFMPFLIGRGLDVRFLIENTGDVPLEVERVTSELCPVFSFMGCIDQEIEFGDGKDPYLLAVGEDAIPVWGGALFHPLDPLLPPLLWDEIQIEVEVRPASERTLAITYRWGAEAVESIEFMHEDGQYHVTGVAPEVIYNLEDGPFLFPLVVLSFYNAAGEFIGAGYPPVRGDKTFEGIYDASRFAKGPIASFKIHFVEGFSPGYTDDHD